MALCGSISQVESGQVMLSEEPMSNSSDMRYGEREISPEVLETVERLLEAKGPIVVADSGIPLGEAVLCVQAGCCRFVDNGQEAEPRWSVALRDAA